MWNYFFLISFSKPKTKKKYEQNYITLHRIVAMHGIFTSILFYQLSSFFAGLPFFYGRFFLHFHELGAFHCCCKCRQSIYTLLSPRLFACSVLQSVSVVDVGAYNSAHYAKISHVSGCFWLKTAPSVGAQTNTHASKIFIELISLLTVQTSICWLLL